LGGITTSQIAPTGVSTAIISLLASSSYAAITSDQVVYEVYSDIDVASTFPYLSTHTVVAVVATLRFEFPTKKRICTDFDSSTFTDEAGHSCTWWTDRSCSNAVTTYGLSAVGMESLLQNCHCTCIKSQADGVCRDMSRRANATVAEGLYPPIPLTTSGLFDMDVSTDFIMYTSRWADSDLTSLEILFLFDIPLVLTDYLIVLNSQSVEYDPIAWVMEATHDLDAGIWATLHTSPTSGLPTTRGETVVYSMGNTIAYMYYRYRITSRWINQGNEYPGFTKGSQEKFALSELRLIQCEGHDPVPCSAAPRKDGAVLPRCMPLARTTSKSRHGSLPLITKLSNSAGGIELRNLD